MNVLATWSPWAWSDHTLQVLTALGTTGAVLALVAVETTKGFRRGWRERRTRPILTLTHDAQVDVAREQGPNPERPGAGNVLIAYIRLGVSNAPGRRAAPAVEVAVKRVDQLAGAADERLPTHNMGPLAWTHRDPLGNHLGPSVSRTVVLGYAFADEARLCVGLGIPRPNSKVDVLKAGTYRFTLTISAANVDACDWAVTLSYDGKLTETSDPTDHLKIVGSPQRVA